MWDLGDRTPNRLLLEVFERLNVRRWLYLLPKKSAQFGIMSVKAFRW